MRDDMFKVIVERPRRVNSNAYSRDGRHFRNQEDAPSMLGMKRGYNDTKWFNENLAPLQRFLAKQINRPWDKVYSEIRATIDARSTVKHHILQHLEDFVAIHTRWVETPEGGSVVVREGSWSSEYVDLANCRYQLFVHPCTGILLRNRQYTSYAMQKKEKGIALAEEKYAVRRTVNERLQLHRIGGVWYEVKLALLPAARAIEETINGVVKKRLVYDRCWDVARKAWVARQYAPTEARNGKPGNHDMYGDGNLYAISKRQLNSRELATYGLQ